MTKIFYNVLENYTMYICTYILFVGIYFYKHAILLVLLFLLLMPVCRRIDYYGIYEFNQVIFIEQEKKFVVSYFSKYLCNMHH